MDAFARNCHALHQQLGAFGALCATAREAEGAVAYARCSVISPEQREVSLGIGSNDSARVWVNGELVFSKHTPRSGKRNEDAFPVRLKAGPNDILVKVENLGGGWHLYLTLRDAAQELRFEAP